MRQRLAIALFVFGIGVCVYLANSAAPLRVHLVEIFFQLGFLGIASLLTWWPDLSSQVRVYGLVSLVLLGYFVRNALLNRVMSKNLDPYDPLIFTAGVALLALEALFVVCLTWLLDRAWNLTFRQRSRDSQLTP